MHEDAHTPTDVSGLAVRRAFVAIFSWLAFGALCLAVRAFVLDDAFIVLRFGQHLAEGRGLVWNVGDEPVQGFTSMAWVVLSAIGHWIPVDPLAFLRAIGFLCGLTVLWLVAQSSYREAMPLTLAPVAMLALDPAFALLAIQGLETSLAALLCLLAALTSLRTLDGSPDSWRLWLVLVVAASVRLDTLAFTVPLAIGTLSVLLWSHRGRDVRRLVVMALPFAVGSSVYAIWLTGYFGSLVPTTAVVKITSPGEWWRLPGARYVLSSLLPLLPLSVLAAGLAWTMKRQKVLRLLPLLLGCLTFMAYLLTVTPIQGFLGRFLAPIFPVLVLGASQIIVSQRQKQKWSQPLMLLLAVALSVWPLYRLPEVWRVAEERSPTHRIAVGRQLAGLEGTLLSTTAGALPYFSGFRALDIPGLATPEIAREGVSQELLRREQPDLVAINPKAPGRDFSVSTANEREVYRYLVENGYLATVAIQRGSEDYLFYFVNPRSPIAAALDRRLRTVPGVAYGDLVHLTSDFPDLAQTPSARPD